MYLHNKPQSVEAIEKAAKEAGCVEFLSREPNEDEKRPKHLQFHHTVFYIVLPGQNVDPLKEKLMEISSLSDDLNKLLIEICPMSKEDGSPDPDKGLIIVNSGKFLPR